MEVVVIGAGVCGLTTAIALVRHGISVCVIEQRKDPESAAGVSSLRDAAALLDQANSLFLNGEYPDELLHQTARIRRKYWGTYARNVMMDSHSLAYMEYLNVPTDAISKITHLNLNGPPDGPTFSVAFPERKIQPEINGLNIERMLLQRDWAALAALGDLEQCLLTFLRQQSGATITFGCTALAVTELKDIIEIHTNQSTLEAQLVIVTDGGGKGALSRKLATRKVHNRELISLSVLEADSNTAICGLETGTVFSHSTLTDDGWIGIFCSGKTVSTAVNVRGFNSTSSYAAWQTLNKLGLKTAFIEPPIELYVEVAETDNVLPGTRIILAGDAAMSGNPRFGLGVQFGLAWAQLLEQTLTKTDQLLALDSDVYLARSAEIIDKRREFELAWMEMVDNSIRDKSQLSSYLVSAAVLQSLETFSVDYSVRGKSATYNFRLVLDAQLIPEADDSPVAMFLRQIGRFTIDADLKFKENKKSEHYRLSAKLTDRNRLDLKFGDEHVSICSGRLDFLRDKSGWTISVDSASGFQTSQGEFETEFPFHQLTLHVPDDFLDMAILQASQRSELFLDKQFEAQLSIKDARKISWGPLDLRMIDSPKLSVRLMPGPVIEVVFKRGQVIPINVTEFAHHSTLSGTRWLSGVSRLSGGLLDPVVNQVARVAASTIKALSIKLNRDETALITFHGLVPISIRLNKTDARRLRIDLLNSALLGQLVSDAGSNIVELKARVR